MSNKNNLSELLTLIDKSAHAKETKSTPELNAIFLKFNEKKDHNLNKALLDLKADINFYQLQHNYQAPKFLTRIALDISQVNNVNEGAGIGAFFSNLWF
ncbi:hypothetical protein [Weissella bombi]|uniref:Enterocin A Immunity n=1 Tax=Weissella bombi TaxID=1505725 RepID=A0A1C3ZQQ1_9LACO|nr:hypothetical protein [Weissella bombi]SCB84655.1 hypothetical protein GA0061074_102148 [Weissella bombi]